LNGGDLRPSHGQEGDAKTAASDAPAAPAENKVQETPAEQVPLASEVDAEAQALREHLKKMRSLMVQYHLSEGPGQSKPLQRQWIQMLETGRKLHRRLIDAAVAELRKNPKGDSPTATLLFEIAARNADADRFDGMLEVVKLLKEVGFTAPQFDLCCALTAAANNDYEWAQPHAKIAMENLEKAMVELSQNKEVPDDEREAMGKEMFEVYGLLSELSDTARMEPLWEEEQQMRQADADGQPLPHVRIRTTKGDFVVELFENQAPNTVANFISLCEKGFYDGLPFHRVITHFMAQGGCPNRDGTGGPGYTIRTEIDDKAHRKFFRGTLGMALSGAPDSGGSQFFVCYLPRTYLNGKYVAFGRVIEGMNVLSDFVHIDPDDKHAKTADLPDEIIATEVLRKRDHPYQPETVAAQ
jgi:cyclophilin family peptidyl-prolyl cis-trans isomerase